MPELKQGIDRPVTSKLLDGEVRSHPRLRGGEDASRRLRESPPHIRNCREVGPQHSRQVPGHGLVAPAVPDQVGGHAADFPASGDKKLHEIIFAALGTLTPEVGVVATDSGQGRAANEGGAAASDKVPEEQAQVDLALENFAGRAVEHSALAIDAAAEGVDEAGLDPPARIEAICWAILSGCHRSSESIGATKAPPVAAMPALRAAATPEFSKWSRRMRLSSVA